MLTTTTGQLNKRVVLLTPSTSQDAAGGPEPPTASSPIWASIDSTSGQNLYQGQFVSESTHIVTIRYRPAVTPNFKVGFGSRTFNILYVVNRFEENVWLDLLCNEVL